MGLFETISKKPFTAQELIYRQLHFAEAKLSIAGDLTECFALICELTTIELNINPGETGPHLLTVYAVTSSLLVVLLVLVKVAIMYITPQLETAIFFSRYDIKELDNVNTQHITSYAERIWMTAGPLSFLLFGFNFIVLIWVKYKEISMASVRGGTIIIAPVLVVILIFSLYVHFRIRKRNRRGFLNEDKIVSGSPKVRFSKKVGKLDGSCNSIIKII